MASHPARGTRAPRMAAKLGSTSAQEGCGHTSDRTPADRMEDRRQGGLPSAACMGPLVDHILCVRGGASFSSADAHFRIHCAMGRGVEDFVVQDLKGFFDHLHLQDILPILRKLGAPACLEHLLTSVYNGSERLFTSRGFVAPQWVSAIRGLIQGDPLSPLLALTVGHLWATHMLVGPAKGLIYVNDRLLWVENVPDRASSMRAALARSHQFDSAFHLVCEPAKCAVATAAQDSPYRSLAGELGYPLRRSLEILGVLVDLQTRSATPLRLVLDKLVWRLRYIKLLPAPVHRKIQLLWPLAFASVFWCAGVAAPDSSVLDSVQTETLNVFTSSFTHEVPAFLKHVLLGWHTSPQFLQDFTALRRAALFGALRPLWLEDAPLTEGAASWMALLPQARDALQRHGWTALPHEQGFSRTDGLGRRRDFHFGHTSLRVLRQWLEEAFVSQGVHKCGRVRDGFHRPDPACARGLDLPKPPKTATLQLCGP